jgi:hypothetical protein
MPKTLKRSLKTGMEEGARGVGFKLAEVYMEKR